MQYSSSLIAVAGLLTTVAGHGSLTSPTPRPVGQGYRSVCGEQIYNNQLNDRNGNIQGLLQVARSQTDVTADCNLWLCKGYQFSDNPAANVQTYTAGQVVPMTFNVAAPHTGPANVSIVHIPTGAVIGAPLISWDEYASNAIGATADELNFSITIPAELGDQCATAGMCVIQHWWDARSVDQTYESCVDFTVGGSGAPTAPSTPPVEQPAAPPAPPVEVPSDPTTLVTSNRPAATVPPVAYPAPVSPPAPVDPPAPVTPPVPVTPPTTNTTGGEEEEEEEECE